MDQPVLGLRSDFEQLRRQFDSGGVRFPSLVYYIHQYGMFNPDGSSRQPPYTFVNRSILMAYDLSIVGPTFSDEEAPADFVQFVGIHYRGEAEAVVHGLYRGRRESYSLYEACRAFGRLTSHAGRMLQAGIDLSSLGVSTDSISNRFDDQRWLLAIFDIIQPPYRETLDDNGHPYKQHEIDDIFLASLLACGRIVDLLSENTTPTDAIRLAGQSLVVKVPAPSSTLTEREQNIVEAVGEKTLKAEQISILSGYSNNASFRDLLSQMVKRGILRRTKGRSGYYLG